MAEIQAERLMTLNLTMPERAEIMPKITVFGVGGAGGNAVNNMIVKELVGVDFVVANTDAQALRQNTATARIQMGLNVTAGLGAGAKPAVGAAAAEETIEEIVDHLAGSHLCFITAGMGGGTGTGAAPIIAQAARELGILTVGVVTKPFQFEGIVRMRVAEEGVELLQSMVDTLITIPNQNLFRLTNEKTTVPEAFAMADEVLYQGVKGVTDLMVRPGLINLDFADVRTVMDEMGKAMMGSGEATGEERAKQAAEKAIANPLLDEISLQGARGVLINITGGHDLTLFELDEAVSKISSMVDRDATIIMGSTLDETMDGVMRVSIVATGIDVEASEAPETSYDEAAVLHSGEAPPEHAAAESVIPDPETPQHRPAPDFPTEMPSFARTAGSGADMFQEAPQMVLDAPDVSVRPVRESAGARDDHAPWPAAGNDPEPVPMPFRRLETDIPAQPIVETQPEAADSAARRPGVPSPETMARLRAAVARNPEPLSTAARDRPVEVTGKQRFRVNSLIDRMTKSRDPASQPDPSQGGHASVSSAETRELRANEHDRVGIPAFLRRQAN